MPLKYWEFAMPLKLFDYIKYNKPIIAVKNTKVGSFVNNNGIGWCIDYNKDDLENLFNQFLNNLNLINSKIKNIQAICKNHTWENRINTIKNVMYSHPNID